MNDPRKHTLGVLLPVLLLQQTLGALSFPISRYGLAFIEPFTFAFYRFAVSSIVLLAFVAFRKHGVRIERRDYKRIIGLGFLIIPINQTLYLYGQSLTAAGHASLLFATTPIWIFLAALYHLKERLVRRRAAGVVLAVIGVITIMASGAIKISTDYLWGDIIILIAVIAWAYYTILGKPLAEKYGALRVTAYALASGSAMYFPFGLFAAGRFEYSSATVGGWGAVLYMALGTSVVAYVLWFWVLKHMPATRVAVFHNLQPIIASGVAYLWLGERLGWPFVVGGVIVLAGVVVAEL